MSAPHAPFEAPARDERAAAPSPRPRWVTVATTWGLAGALVGAPYAAFGAWTSARIDPAVSPALAAAIGIALWLPSGPLAALSALIVRVALTRPGAPRVGPILRGALVGLLAPALYAALLAPLGELSAGRLLGVFSVVLAGIGVTSVPVSSLLAWRLARQAEAREDREPVTPR